ncbi:glycosyltransferase family 4 protein [Macrococcoides caseolyticum]|uniref:glycosyltransferase family 4 protein n=1 Tax=Macrococcoides caseolyticum TaxID=69966 RepID=UPI000C330D0E|nr:glycosyltransferase family 4 protein [Macrococcus caseolyticus]PKE21930.1 glycosyltransferase WbuB [Macrococcus caseolyticus]PKE36704.1 glycosyltransferase WbuB [Macrococcus caseolyticus]PKE60726.1 glycosyltransferase WbuB [Macrococcus caseolyticus]PKE72568.1 glycosyltransferase WbuB [Macrococcus caseolyticus]PKE75679.1 glycosyltransferase WbuB [Macrococcus caseolyticus]
MRIIVFSQYYEPEPFLIHDKMKELVVRGHEVTVLTGLPNYPKGEILKGYKPGTEVKDGVNILRLPIRARKSGAKNLFLNYISYVKEANKYLKRNDIDYNLIYVYQLSPLLMAIPAIKLKKIKKIPLIIYCLDLWPESLVSGGIKKGSIVYRIFKVISKRIYKNADSIHISSKSFEKYFRNVLKINKNFIYNPQYAVENEHDILLPNMYNEKYINLTFTGNVGEMQDLETLLNALPFIDNNVRIHIVGDGSKLESLKQTAKNLNIEDKIVFHGRRPIEEMYSYMYHSDALLVTMKVDEVISYTLPAKIQSYLKSGKFIIGAINGEANQVIKDSESGFVSPASDEKLLAENINHFIKDMPHFKKLGSAGTEYYNKHFGKDKFITTLLKDMERLIK